MATYFVASGGSNTAPYDTWAKAATSLATAMAAATAAGDIVVIQYNAVPTGDAEAVGAVTITFAAQGVLLVAASNDGGSAWTPTVMGTGNWIGNSTTNRTVEFTGAYRCATYGLTIRTGGASTGTFALGIVDGQHIVHESGYFWLNSAAGSVMYVAASESNCFVHLKNCTLRFGNAGQKINLNSRFLMEGGDVSSAGTAPTALINWSAVSRNGGTEAIFRGVDLSFLGSGTLVSDTVSAASTNRFEQCKLGASYVALATQTFTSKCCAEVFITDCASGDTHGLFGYHNGLGSAVSNTGIYVTAGAAAQSWKVSTTSACSRYAPFETPWIALYNTGTSAITPYFEILRDGSSTAYTDAQVWAEFMAKITSGSTQASLSTGDRAALSAAGSSQAAGAGTGSWTGENATAWSGKCDSGSSITPAEAGYLRGRIVVGAASVSDLYVDPQIRV